MTAIYINVNCDDDTRRQRLYAGDLYIYSPRPSTEALCAHARQMAEEAFAPLEPQQAQRALPVDRYVEILADLKPRFIHHPKSKSLIQKLLADFDCDMTQTYFDVPRLRTATSGNYLSSGLAYAFKPHRDTWYSPPMCQLNWWLPVYDIEANNGMAFHPHYWSRPIRNSSAEFNYQTWNETGRRSAASQVGRDTRRQSEALETLDLEPELRVVSEASGLVVFSAAHLHSTVANRSGRTRISIDFRTVHLEDVRANTGAPKVDAECTGTTMMDYLRGIDLTHVPENIIRRYMHLSLTPEFSTVATTRRQAG